VEASDSYWRMVQPARYLNTSRFNVDISSKEIIYDYLMSYDTIVCQRINRWDQFYVLEKLKKAGKKIVYDLDDNIFDIPESNPAYRAFGNDEKQAARAIMGLADVIVTPSEVIKNTFGYEDKTLIFPNAIDPTDGWNTDKNILSPDNLRRIYWTGSATHEEDWEECIFAVDRILKKYRHVRLLILGFLPQCVLSYMNDVNRPWWKDKVEYSKFMSTETYIAMMKHIRADVAIAPLKDNRFNACKSCVKYVEYTMTGIPVVASNVTPYKEPINHAINGLLAKDEDEWFSHIEALVSDQEFGKTLVRNARTTVGSGFDIRKEVKKLEAVL